MPSPELEPLLVFTLDGRRFGLKASVVQRALRAAEITPLPDAPAGVRGLVNMGGTIVPVYDLRARFSLPLRDVRSSDFFVIATAHGRTVAVLVDDLEGLMECSVTPTEEVVAAVELINGVVKTDTELVLIHDLDKFLSDSQSTILEAALQR
jgi:purine-binding chemotaxis protein CheW